MTDDAPYFAGQLLVAMPGMADPRFDRSVIYMCAHSDEGALGLVVNQLVDSIDFPELLEQLNIDSGDTGAPDPRSFRRAGRDRPRLCAALRRLHPR